MATENNDGLRKNIKGINESARKGKGNKGGIGRGNGNAGTGGGRPPVSGSGHAIIKDKAK